MATERAEWRQRSRVSETFTGGLPAGASLQSCFTGALITAAIFICFVWITLGINSHPVMPFFLQHVTVYIRVGFTLNSFCQLTMLCDEKWNGWRLKQHRLGKTAALIGAGM